MRIGLVKAVSALALTAPIVGPAAVLLAHSNATTSSPSAACPAGTSAHNGGTYQQSKSNLTPIRVSGNNQCYAGVSVTGNFPASQTWWQLKQCCNGAAITVDSGNVTLVNARTQNIAVDGIRTWNHAATTIIGAHSTDTRDDCISDITHGALDVRGSLFDGCHTGISWRSTNNNNHTPFAVNVQNSLFYIKPMTDHGGGGNCKSWVQGGKDNGTMWKMDGVQKGVTVTNVVIRMDLANYQCVDTWPSGTYNNVWLVWNNSKPYPGKLPAGVTMTRDVSVWDNAKARWTAAHSGGSNPSPQPSTSPTGQPTPPPSGGPSPQPSPSGSPVPGQSPPTSGGTVPTTCPTHTVTMHSGSTFSDGASSTTYDGRGATYTETTSSLTPVTLNGSSNCLVGVTVNSNIDRTIKWWQMKQCCNGAGVTLNGSAYLKDVRIDNAGVDGIRTWNSAPVTYDGVYETYTRDDCISDITHGDLIVRDSLFDGCHTGISWRSSNGSTKAFKVDIQDSLFYVQPEPGSTSGGSCTQWVINGKANGPMWKMDGFHGPVNLKNVVIRQDYGNHECADSWPTGTFTNVKFVWTSSKPYPGKLPAGVTMTNDINVWNSAKSAWLSGHGY